MPWQDGDYLTPTNLNNLTGSLISSAVSRGLGIFSVRDYGALGNDAADDTAAFQATLNAVTANNGIMHIPPGIYRCGLIVDSSSSRLAIEGTSGATIRSMATAWLWTGPLANGKYGLSLRDLTFGTPVSGNTWMSPLIKVQGSSTSGGVVEVDIDRIVFRVGGAACDGLHLVGVFNGRISNIYGSSMESCRAIVYDAEQINSGNIHFDTVSCAGAAVALQIGKNNQNLLNQILASNIKCVRTANTEAFNYIRTTSSATTGDTSITVAANSAVTGDWIIVADTNNFADVIRIAGKPSATVLSLQTAIGTGLASGITLCSGNFGMVLGTNLRGFQANTPHFESYGAGVVCSSSQQVQINNATMGLNVRRGVVCINGAQNTRVVYPVYSKSEISKVLMEVHNQGTNSNNAIIAPAGFSSGTGPDSFLSDAATETSHNRYWPEPETQFVGAVGSATAPSFTFGSELSLGFYRSSTSIVLLSYGTLGSNGPLTGSNVRVTTGGEFVVGGVSGTTRVQAQGAGLGVLGVGNGFIPWSASTHIATDGAAISPTYAFNSELSLGFFRSANSNLRLSYGTFDTRGGALSFRTHASNGSSSNLTNGEFALINVSTTSAQLAYRSGNTTYIFNAVQASP